MKAPAATLVLALVCGAAPAGAGEPAALTEEMAQPYLTDGAAGHGAAHFALEEWQPAKKDLAAALRSATGADAARLRLLIALCDTHLDRWADAAAGFEAALPELPLLTDYLHYQAARARYFAHDFDAALAHARKVAADSRWDADARLLVADVLRGGRDEAAVAAAYEKYLAAYPNGIRLAEVRVRLAEAYEALGRAVPDALSLYRKVTIADPLSSWAELAQGRVEVLVAGLPRRDRARYTTFSADEQIERGMALYDAMRNAESEAAFAAALTAPGLTDDTRCVAAYHLANSVFKARDRKRAAPLFDDARAACAKTSNADLQVKAAYQGGRSYAMSGDPETAADRFAEAERVHPDHSFADDARVRQAEQWATLDKQAKVTELLSTVPTLYPNGDMRAEALWRLAWRAYKDKKYDETVRWLQAQIAAMPIDDNYWAEGQPQYWLGRTYARLGRDADAVAAYRDCVRTYPLSYYALLALNRLREDHPRELRKLLAEIQRAPAGEAAGAPAFRFAPRAIYGEPGFRRAVEFLRLGLGGEAEAELARLGLGPPSGKAKVTDPDTADQLWAVAFLYDRAGRVDKSHWIARWHVVDYKRSWPVGANRARWRIAYPTAFAKLLGDAARAQGYPPELLTAFVREESAFDPLMESFANAIGLTQMIMPTARRFGRGLGWPITRETLRDPAKNVAVGSRFLAFLWRKFDGRVALIVPSYNAGEGATMRWLRERGDWPRDEFAEEIPYDETRLYSKRVIASYFAYAYLRDGTIPQMPN